MYLWRAVDHEGEILEVLVQRRRDRRAAVKLMRKLMRKQGFAPKRVVTDKLRSYAPTVIAWGRIKDPAATKHGQEIGLASAYDGHSVEVGRILADSTWHHWFDINLTGIQPLPSPYAGFDDTSAGQAALKQIDAYFLNCGVWLAPPDRQAAMRKFGWWLILWTDRIVELGKDVPIWRLGEEAIDALGRRASRCTVSEWILNVPVFKEKIPHWEWPRLIDRFQLVQIPFETYAAGGILRKLMEEVGPANGKSHFPREAPADDVLDRAMDAGVADGLDALRVQLSGEAALAAKFAQGEFRLPAVAKERARH
jgi:hypothetical protein